MFLAVSGSKERTGVPSMMTSPRSGLKAPAMIFIRVDLPAPFSPITAWTSPFLIFKEIESRALTPGKDFEIFCISRALFSLVISSVMKSNEDPALQPGLPLCSAIFPRFQNQERLGVSYPRSTHENHAKPSGRVPWPTAPGAIRLYNLV